MYNKQPKVSMVMPCYNKVKYISAMFDSVLAQEWDNIELILVNDGSTDGTREIISEYEPKFISRGYEAVIIDQENAGTADAVKNGLSRITGEYVCCVDCDDELHPEYISKMAMTLLNNPGYAMVACDVERLWRNEDGSITKNTYGFAGEVSEDYLLNLLLLRVSTAVYRYLVRTSYLESCGVVKNFYIRKNLLNDPPGTITNDKTVLKTVFITQEQSYIIPLAAGDGRVYFLDDRLYISNLFDSESRVLRRINDRTSAFVRDCISRHAVNALENTAQEKRRLHIILDYAMIKRRFIHASAFHDDKDYISICARDAADYVNRHFIPCPEIEPELILKTGYHTFCQAVENCILKNKKEKPYIPADSRVIGIGAGGVIAKKLVPALAETALQCDVLWDSMAVSGDCLNGLQITKPDFDNLQQNNIIVLLTRNSELHEIVKENTAGKGICCLAFYQVLDFLAAHYYSPLQHCSFTADDEHAGI